MTGREQFACTAGFSTINDSSQENKKQRLSCPENDRSLCIISQEYVAPAFYRPTHNAEFYKNLCTN